jgi:hypothetical protein
VPVARHPDDATGPVKMPSAASRSQALRVLDPPPRAVHDTDEITPPATDIADLIRDRGKP